MPSRAFSSAGFVSHPFTVCGPSQPDAGPWQFSQLTPSLISKLCARSSAFTARAWHARHFSLWLGAAFSPRILPILTETSFDSTWYARACLSCPAQIVYSFWGIRVTVFGRMLPWHALDAH